ncbi:MAG: PAS domain-containing protein [Pleurocapsa sp. MO_192.B19]|nr:PAS domain-containing protein [Pleurocapsa sp. MO_192.B19]
MNYDNQYLAKAKIVKELGYFPAFLLPAMDSPLIFRSLVQHTLAAYINNPLPVLLKEKLFVYLSRYFNIDYLTICHSCELRSLGVKGSDILALGKIKYPQTETDLSLDLYLLNNRNQHLEDWQNNSQIEASLLRCSILIFLKPFQTDNCSVILKQFLGEVNYNYLLIFLGYINLCHKWVVSHPEISHQHDHRSQLYLGSLLLEEIELAEFFKSKVQLENYQQVPALVTTLATKTYSATHPRDSPKLLTLIASDYQLRQKTINTCIKTCLANVPYPVMIYNQDGQVLHLNRNWLKTTGYSVSEITTIDDWQTKAQVKQAEIVQLPVADIGRSHFPLQQCQSLKIAAELEIILQQVISSILNLSPGIAQIKAAEQISRTVSRQIIITTSCGKQRFWQLHITPLDCLEHNQGELIAEGRERLTIAIAKDVTDFVLHESKGAAEAKAEAKLKLVLEATKTANWSWNLTNNQINICHRGRAILGLTDFDGSYEHFWQSVHPDEKESVDLAAIKSIKAKKELNLEYRIVKPNNQICWIRARGKLCYDTTGQGIQLTGVVTDITQEKQSPKKLNNLNQSQQPKVVQSLKELETLLNLLPYYLFVVDLETKSISVINSGLVQSLGLSDPETIKGKKIAECFTLDYANQILWQHQQVVTDQKVLHLQEEVTLPDGIHYFDTVITPLRNNDGEIHALLHTSSDIPNLAATQEALSQRTLQLEAANRELESFSYSVSHDLQAPLRVINGFSQVLWDNYQPSLDDRGKHYLQRIQANSQRMSNLIDALLQLSRVTRSQMKSVTVNLSQIALDIIEELQGQEPERQVEFNIASNLHAQGDPQLLRIVLNNLLHNAWKYTSKRSHSKIEFNVLPGDNPQPTYFVRDNGAGFELEYAGKLFTAFKRLHSQQDFPGTGIGLATVQRIIYRHGGKVWAEGERDRGATIYFSL